MTKDITLLIALEAIMIDKMREIRGLRVMLDIDLAELYEVRVSYLRRQVTRNIDRFPEDFMFRLTRKELESSKTGQLPYAFTEKGILMAGGVLDSERAIKVHIQLVRYFVQLYKESLSNNLLLEENRAAIENKEVEPLFEILKQMLKS